MMLLRMRRMYSSTASVRMTLVGVGAGGSSIVQAVSQMALPVKSVAERSLVALVDDSRALSQASDALLRMVVEQSADEKHSAQIVRDAFSREGEKMFPSLSSASVGDVAVVVSDLGEAIGVGGAPIVCEALRATGCLTLSVAILPLPWGGQVRANKVIGLRFLICCCSRFFFLCV